MNQSCTHTQQPGDESVCGIYRPRLAGYKTCISISSLPSLALGGLACLAGLQRAQGTKDGTCSHHPPPPLLHHHGFLLSPSPFLRIRRACWAGGEGKYSGEEISVKSSDSRRMENTRCLNNQFHIVPHVAVCYCNLS